MFNSPPDDFILDAIQWLREEIYPGLLGEQFDDRACAVWICGSRGYISIWQTIGHDDNPGVKHEQVKQTIYNRINQIKNPPSVAGGAGTIEGQLRVERLGFIDNNGPVLPVFCHFGEAFSAYVRRPNDVRDELARIKNAGYTGIRFWDVLGYWDVAWAGREVSPVPFTNHSGVGVRATPDYYVRLAEFLRTCKEIGLKVHHSRGDQNSWNRPMIEGHLREVAKVQRQVGLDVVALNEISNESWQNGLPDPVYMKQLCDLLPSETIRGTSAADDQYGGETPEAFASHSKDVQIIHGYRGGESHNRIAHIMAVGYETIPSFGKPAWQSEPTGPGPGVSVGREENVEALCLMALMSLATHQAYNYMSSHGVFWNGSISEMPGFAEVPRAVANILPRDIMNGWEIFHGGDRWAHRRILVANSDGTLRCDHIMKGRDFLTIAYGRPGTWQIPVAAGFDGDLIRPATLERLPVSKNAGDTLNVAFERGLVLKGQVR